MDGSLLQNIATEKHKIVAYKILEIAAVEFLVKSQNRGHLLIVGEMKVRIVIAFAVWFL